MCHPNRGLSFGTFLLPLLALLFLASCGGTAADAPTVPEDPSPHAVTISPGDVTLHARGAMVQFSATVRDKLGREIEGHPVSWVSSVGSVADVDSDGLATGWADGSSMIIAIATPTVSGWATVTVDAVDLEITSGSPPVAILGEPFEFQLKAVGVATPVWSVMEGTLPSGLTLDPSTGRISGTPAEVGKSRFTVRLASGGQFRSVQLTITVISGLLGTGFELDQFSLIPAGSFQMGSATGYADEQPVHQVNITQPFLMQKTEVTQRQWIEIMGYNPSAFGACGETCPVERVSWEEIQTFLLALNAAYPDADFRLPTEAQWEYAARAGTPGDYGGTGDLETMGWYFGNSGSRTQFVGLKQSNAWGLYDMHGNAFEWVRDWYAEDYYSVSPADDPPGPLGGEFKVLRGGSVDQNADRARSSYRLRSRPDRPGFTVYYGFRLVRDPA